MEVESRKSLRNGFKVVTAGSSGRNRVLGKIKKTGGVNA
jgi:hypothetical protein